MINLLLMTPNAADGTSFYRGVGPYSYLDKQCEGIKVTFTGSKTLFWSDLIGFNVIVFQRPASQTHFEGARLAKKMGIAIIVDHDDHLEGILPENRMYSVYSHREVKFHFREILKLADLVTTTTNYLKGILSQYNDNVVVVPNALDDRYFSTSQAISFPRQEKTILWRGGDSHNGDFNAHKEDILKIFKAYPDWKFISMGGLCPEWIMQNIPRSKNIAQYEFDDVITYFNNLLTEAPELVIVPLGDSPFNRAKSNNAWMEAVYAGAWCIGPNWEEWNDKAMCYNYGDSLFDTVAEWMNVREDLEYGRSIMDAINQVPLLSDTCEQRHELIDQLVGNSIIPVLTPFKEEAPFSEEEFFNYELANGFCQDNANYMKVYRQFCDFVIETINPKQTLDIGCGTGTIPEIFNDLEVGGMGIDLLQLNVDYFNKRNPDLVGSVVQADIKDVQFDMKFDFISCIEVFEHIPDEVLKEFIPKLSKHCKWFLFSSTPYSTQKKFDHQWGHINLKPTEHWQALFEQNGFKLIQRPKIPTVWSMLFVSLN